MTLEDMTWREEFILKFKTVLKPTWKFLLNKDPMEVPVSN